MTQSADLGNRKGLLGYLLSKTFYKHLLFVLVTFIVCFFIATFWLKMYTKHGQQRELPDYQGMQITIAEDDAKEQNFKLVVTDSIHVVGESGGKILRQNPEPFSRVKSGRTIYVTVTKNEADQIPTSRLPSLYGENYDRKKNELVEHFEIRSKVIGKKFDPGVPGQILEVSYQGQTIIDRNGRKNDVKIEKGGLLEFVISERRGGSVNVPDLVCMQYSEAKFLLESIGLFIGDITYSGPVSDLSTAYITSYSNGGKSNKIERGTPINVEVSDTAPPSCE